LFLTNSGPEELEKKKPNSRGFDGMLLLIVQLVVYFYLLHLAFLDFQLFLLNRRKNFALCRNAKEVERLLYQFQLFNDLNALRVFCSKFHLLSSFFECFFEEFCHSEKKLNFYMFYVILANKHYLVLKTETLEKSFVVYDLFLCIVNELCSVGYIRSKTIVGNFVIVFSEFVQLMEQEDIVEFCI
jgi:hypothetical protein